MFKILSRVTVLPPCHIPKNMSPAAQAASRSLHFPLGAIFSPSAFTGPGEGVFSGRCVSSGVNKRCVGSSTPSGHVAPIRHVRDEFDETTAKVWELYTGGRARYTPAYKQWISEVLTEHGVKTVLDAACAIGLDSILLLEMGYTVVSSDGSDHMIKRALELRWERRKEEAFDNWVIKEANWLSLRKDLQGVELASEGFDAVLCMGNSFPCLHDTSGDGSTHRLAIQNFYDVLRPGGILVIDHRNYDVMLKADSAMPKGKSIFYSYKYVKNVKISTLFVNGSPTWMTSEAEIDVDSVEPEMLDKLEINPASQESWSFCHSLYPHKLASFKKILHDVFGANAVCKSYGDFQAIDEIENPLHFIHVIEKPLVGNT